MITRRTALAAGLATLAAPAAHAQDWPTRPLRLVAPFAPGGPADFIGRMVAEKLKDALGQPVVVENRVGAGGSIGHAQVAASEPDGYSLVLGTLGTHTMTPLLIPGSRVDPAKDLAAVGTVAALPNVLVVLPKRTDIADITKLIARGRQRTDELSFGTFGPGSSPHVVTEMFQRSAGFRALQVPFTGSATALTALLGEQIDFLFDSITTSLSHIRGGSVRALAVSSASRSAVLPEVPTLGELGIRDVEFSLWLCVYAPLHTPAPLLTRLRQAMHEISMDRDYIARLEARGAEACITPVDRLPQFLDQETARWRQFLRDTGMRSDG
ncbi:tripartite tricarboxylate transporter substrate binding protein [Roseomonas sp. JC162]|uniref:Tripartite tricarboxylate transporter substrate binding protein n=1 Tax=Neoroseomonas marina TaxID=1232220 RepID=A0A848EJ73_9PROT|nr:tripartite tricarboxylate transporter substrate binding protein [Neoroseomonas marina]NMJ43505.1 tripartite tricarboxylate transporter substrate binding protein [Neoroseomonas marina]